VSTDVALCNKTNIHTYTHAYIHTNTCMLVYIVVLGQFIAGQFVADSSSRTIRRGHFVADNSSQSIILIFHLNLSRGTVCHGQFVAKYNKINFIENSASISATPFHQSRFHFNNILFINPASILSNI